MKHHVRAHILIVLALVLLLAWVPAAVAEQPVVLAGTGAGEGFGTASCTFRVHFNSKAGGSLWMSAQFPDRPGYSGTFSAALSNDDYIANDSGFATVGTVVASDIPEVGVGEQFAFYCIRVDDTFYVWAGDIYAFFVIGGHVTLRT